METKAIYRWLHDWIVAKEGNRPVLQDIHIDAGYAYGTDGYALARIPLSLIVRDKWLQYHQIKYGFDSTHSHFFPPTRLPCGSDDICNKDGKPCKYPDPRTIYLRAWSTLETVDMRELLWEVQTAKAHQRDSIRRYEFILGIEQLNKLLHCPAFLCDNVEVAVTVTNRRDECFLRFTASNEIELYIMPMSGD